MMVEQLAYQHGRNHHRNQSTDAWQGGQQGAIQQEHHCEQTIQGQPDQNQGGTKALLVELEAA